MDIESAVVVTDGQQWQKDLPELGDLEVLVAPWENPAFERAMQKGIRALPPALRADGNIDPTAYGKVLGRAIARTVLFGWRNFTSGGVEKPFDAAYAEQLLSDAKYKPFRDGVMAAARRVQQGVKAEDEAVLGNLLTSSSGSVSGAQTSSS
ncbi:hypothetical protein IVB45_17525 [Bradyrhizobium sp. 4]|uniref:hypothetical protein n=1 Tax=unclassified Bradyrhizobium TaxID=2631580 RepID=UPI001FF89837|nr:MULTISPECIES: hypothetical protein [unclassified Bradyrhizobium]MCK1402024.1 hypothetical protein [Bradyrhizobium sp. 39]MCK1751256.1 hypothetical protein [Bradyrhizobium sp. 135]UPJ38509.1 hypothetical protein IVB45_17525 [Bradyrhizobium sp. 4]